MSLLSIKRPQNIQKHVQINAQKQNIEQKKSQLE